ncbi:MAG TPA: ABC transporter substrate-binding protein [Bacteroidia bacterium]|nr:ABC transporter substrate-binding protein [Bacteroidia bacterium]
MNKLPLLFIFASILILSSCSGNKPKDVKAEPVERAGKGGRVYGGFFRFGMTEDYQTLYPLKITDAPSAHIASQVYEGLVKFNTSDLSLIPGLAEKWELSADGTVYTFHLKKGVKFQDDACFTGGKGRELKASDIKYSLTLLCTQDAENNSAFDGILKDRLVGANDYYDASKNGTPSKEIEGIKVIDDYTISLQLVRPNSSFLYCLANPGAYAVAKEAVEKYGVKMKVGCGPFRVASEPKPGEKILLVRNENYYGTDSLGNKLPFLDSIEVTFFDTKANELAEFQNGKLHFIWGLPSESIKDMVESQISDFNKNPPKYILDRSPEMSTQYYTFNSTKEPFNKLKVRQAFSYALNREGIVENVLRGEAFGPGLNGICPPSFKGYDISKVEGYKFDPAKAKKLLAEAGYPGGKGFPVVKLKLNSGGQRNENVVIEVQKQMHDVLGVNVDFDIVSYKQRLEDESMGNGDIFRSAWIADYPSPENFLWLFHGKSVPSDIHAPSYPNASRYKNPAFDKLFEAGVAAKTQEEAYRDFLEAEKIMIADAPILILWYDENWRLIKSNVHNFYGNAMRYYDFSQVYLKDPEVTKAAGAEESKK